MSAYPWRQYRLPHCRARADRCSTINTYNTRRARCWIDCRAQASISPAIGLLTVWGEKADARTSRKTNSDNCDFNMLISLEDILELVICCSEGARLRCALTVGLFWHRELKSGIIIICNFNINVRLLAELSIFTAPYSKPIKLLWKN